ncbi:hypothetical protein [Haliscomenobacter hydrossis]|uniref:CHAT domain-containing protein n=1 Tax=Haliscomenobacter hydrossis (strain ATCC 27775 / DSM 1100 / LMG 10767 / O) TaxID=760192 RepID=F4KSE3_HALH1|nr:hypothetical protein [Haliscomenobacter hydrossis]AEE53346.1 hypothetical protein Halhy_5521 [Haliscomenobacter hydrossis DSM 1100]
MKINKYIIEEKIIEEDLEEALKLLTILTYKCGNRLNEKVINLSSKLSSYQDSQNEKEIKKLIFYTTQLLVEINNNWEIEDWNLDDGATQKSKILFLASNPKNSMPLRLDEEVRKIEEGLRRSRKRDSFALIQKWALQIPDLRRALLDETPTFIHFSGHGTTDGEIVLEDIQGLSKNVAAKAVGSLFGLFKGSIKCILLNACYSEIQAEEISKHIPFVIGMSDAIPDKAAIEFSEAFYDAIADGREVEFAFDLAVNSIELYNLGSASIPILIKNGEL